MDIASKRPCEDKFIIFFLFKYATWSHSYSVVALFF